MTLDLHDHLFDDRPDEAVAALDGTTNPNETAGNDHTGVNDVLTHHNGAPGRT